MPSRSMRAKAVVFTHAVTVQRPPGEVYAFWRDLENLPRFMWHLERVEEIDGRRSRWTTKSPGGTTSWEAEIRRDDPNHLIEWRTVGRTAVPHIGRVSFEPAPGDRGTEVRVTVGYRPPGGRSGVAVAKLAGEEPSQQVREALRRLKQVLEAGEVIDSGAGPSSARSSLQQRVTRFVQRRLMTGARS